MYNAGLDIEFEYDIIVIKKLFIYLISFLPVRAPTETIH